MFIAGVVNDAVGHHRSQEPGVSPDMCINAGLMNVGTSFCDVWSVPRRAVPCLKQNALPYHPQQDAELMGERGDGEVVLPTASETQ